jgi:hypothetical protein
MGTTHKEEDWHQGHVTISQKESTQESDDRFKVSFLSVASKYRSTIESWKQRILAMEQDGLSDTMAEEKMKAIQWKDMGLMLYQLGTCDGHMEGYESGIQEVEEWMSSQSWTTSNTEEGATEKEIWQGVTPTDIVKIGRASCRERV